MKKTLVIAGSVVGVAALSSVVYGIVKYRECKNEVVLGEIEAKDLLGKNCNCCCCECCTCD